MRSGQDVPHLPSIERWRQDVRAEPYYPNRDSTRQEMRSFVCGQCHVEYYCGPKDTIFFHWDKGLKIEDIEANYEERRFPDGEFFYDWIHGETVTQLPGWPPVMEGVSGSAREAQTIVIYGGELYVGVWPWGEVWRYQPDQGTWDLARRVFSHPEPTTATVHPYETETAALGGVANQWGQRVTSMVPHNDSLFISTSAKWQCEWEPKFGYVGEEAWKEYGTITHVRVPGHLSVPVKWTDGPTELHFAINDDGLRVTQDGKELGTAKLDGIAVGALGELTWGQGAYGVFTGKQVTGKVSGAGE